MKNIKLLLIVFSLISALSNAQQIGFVADTSIGCNTLQVNFSDTNNISNIVYRMWNFGDNSANDSTQNVTHTYDTTGVFTVTLIIKTSTDSLFSTKTITVRKRPIVSFFLKTYGNKTVNGDTLYYSFNKINHISNIIGDTLPYAYTWIIDADTLIDTTANIVKIYQKTGEHNAGLVVSAFGMCSDTSFQTFTIKNEVFLPNIFTPNGDGINDVFYAQTDGTKTYELTIFSRYGSVVYTITAQKVWWDGRTSAGEEASQGTYFYVLKEIDGDTVIKGNVYLGR